MTLDEFFAALEKTPRDWRIARGWIRPANLLRRGEFSQECPLTAVAEFGDRRFRSYGDSRFWRDAAREMGLKKADAQKIVNAADGRGTLRKRLLAACGIKETTG